MRAPRETAWKLDADYLRSLSPSERAFYDKFVAEFYLLRIKKGSAKNLHNETQRRELSRARDSARRCVSSLAGCSGRLDGGDRLPEPASTSVEDALVEFIDFKRARGQS